MDRVRLLAEQLDTDRAALRSDLEIVAGDYPAIEWVASDLLAPMDRWPSPSMITAFRSARSHAERMLGHAPWPEVLDRVVIDLFEGGDSVAAERQLRALSAMISMLAHLEPSYQGARAALNNLHRRRTAYSSYPTPPAVGRVIARYVAAHLQRKTGSAVILDPTMEGAPLLLECALQFRDLPGTCLIGIDRSPVAVRAARTLFRIGYDAIPLARVDLRLGDCFALMDGIGPLDGVVNNPPWGERSRYGAERFPGGADPYAFFVDRCLSQLKSGAPFGFVLPGQAVTSPSARAMRARMLRDCDIDLIAALPKHSFPRATVRAVLLLGRRRGAVPWRSTVAMIDAPLSDLAKPAPTPTLHKVPRDAFPADGSGWLAQPHIFEPATAADQWVKLGSIIDVRAGVVPYRIGRGRPAQSHDVLRTRPFTLEEPILGTTPILRGKQVRPFFCLPPEEYVRLGPHLAYAGDHAATACSPRVFLRELCSRDGRMVAAPAPVGTVPRYGVYALLLPRDLDPLVLCAILNSRIASGYVRNRCDGIFRESFNRIRPGDVRRFPLPNSLLFDPAWGTAVSQACRQRLASVGQSTDNEMDDVLEELIDFAYADARGGVA